MYIFTNQTNNNNALTTHTKRSVEDDISNPNRNRMGIQERFSQTDRALEEVPTWPNVSSKLVRIPTKCYVDKNIFRLTNP